MATRYEYYNTGEDAVYTLLVPFWRAQTFTPATTHTITEVRLHLHRVGTIGDVTVSIRATDVDGHPTGDDLTSGTYDGDTLRMEVSPQLGALEWITIPLTSYNLSAGKKYAIVVRIAGGDVDNKLCYGVDESSPTYTDGCFEYSGDLGVNWTSLTTVDWMFEEWGNPAPPEAVGIMGINRGFDFRGMGFRL